MLSLIPVSSQSLLKRSIDLGDCTYRDAAVLPFFTSEGEVSFCMVVLPQASRLYFFTPCDTGLRLPLWGTIRFQNPEWSWSDGAGSPALSGLWHYDPDWLLRDERFAAMEIVPLLRKTNCCSRLPSDVKGLYYRRDLSRVRFVHRSVRDQVRLVAITEVLPESPLDWSGPDGSPQTGRRTGGWRLDPIWMRSPRCFPTKQRDG